MISRGTAQMYRHRFSAMGCPCEIRLYSGDAHSAARAFALAETEVRRLDLKYSHYREDSELKSMLQAAAHPPGVRVDSETAALLNFAGSLHTESDGRFDITAGRLSALWDRATHVPEARQIKAALALTGWHRLAWDGCILHLPASMRLDLGGIVKEYAADRAALLLRSAGHHSGYVDLGGDLHVLGSHPNGSPWQIGIRHPREAGAMATVAVPRGGLATSGDYERCSIIDGQRYGHILNALTGWPARGLASVSVIAPSCLLAGALSTLAMLQEQAQALDMLAESGLAWLAHDGCFSFARSECMLAAAPNFHTHSSERSFKHDRTQCSTQNFPGRDKQPHTDHSLFLFRAPGRGASAPGKDQPATDCRQHL